MQAARYVCGGLTWLRAAPRLYLTITLVYTAPALVAAWLIAFVRDPSPLQQALIVALPWLTVVLGAVVIMVAVAYQSRDQNVSLGRATRVGVRWVPRYLWTNVHTSIIFWVPTTLLLALRDRLQSSIPDVIWWLLIACVALYLHTRTLLAPFLAIHGDLPGTLAMLTAWRLAGQHLGVCMATLVLGSLPAALPLGILALTVARGLTGPAQEAFAAATPNLTWASIQLIRPILIPALYLLYSDLWHAELARVHEHGGLHVPRLARIPLALTRPLPKLGTWD
jgi:hypothetical protein